MPEPHTDFAELRLTDDEVLDVYAGTSAFDTPTEIVMAGADAQLAKVLAAKIQCPRCRGTEGLVAKNLLEEQVPVLLGSCSLCVTSEGMGWIAIGKLLEESHA